MPWAAFLLIAIGFRSGFALVVADAIPHGLGHMALSRAWLGVLGLFTLGCLFWAHGYERHSGRLGWALVTYTIVRGVLLSLLQFGFGGVVLTILTWKAWS